MVGRQIRRGLTTKVRKRTSKEAGFFHLPELSQNHSKTRAEKDFSPASQTPADGLAQQRLLPTLTQL